jgi:Tol biopolymer transport system component
MLRRGWMVTAAVTFVLAPILLNAGHANAAGNTIQTWKVALVSQGHTYPQYFAFTSISGQLYGVASNTSGGSPFASITGTLSGDSVKVVTTFTPPSTYATTFQGTLSKQNTHLSGTWKNTNKASGKWSADLEKGGGSSEPALVASNTEYSSAIDVTVYGSPGADSLIYAASEYGDAGFTSWSPNGLMLAFHAYEPGVDGNDIVLATRGGQILDKYPVTGGYGLDWAPNGDEIGYLCQLGTLLTISGSFGLNTVFPNVCALNLVTGKSTVIAESSYSEAVFDNNSSFLGRLSWSPDGKTILVDGEENVDHGQCTGTCHAYDVANIARIDVSTGSMTAFGNVGSYSPSYSPNGKEIAISTGAATADTRTPGIYVMPSGGGAGKEVGAYGGGWGADPTWTPDGKDIVFSTDIEPTDAGFPHLWAIPVKGGKLTHLTVTRSNEEPSVAQPLTVCVIPDVKAQTLADATRLVQLSGCGMGAVTGPTKSRDKLHVASQAPPAGSHLPVGSVVAVKLG